MNKHTIRTRLAAILSMVGILIGCSAYTASTANAADNCVKSHTFNTGSSALGGNVKQEGTFDNTNYDCGTTNNLVGTANGALLSRVRVYSDYAINQGKMVVCLDVWGDGTSDFYDYATINPVYDGIVSSHYQYTISAASIASHFSAGFDENNVRRVEVIWYKATDANASIRDNVTNNPYGYNNDAGSGCFA